MGFAWPWELRKNGVLNMNQRNIDYIGRYNPRKFYKRVDDKLITKQLALANDIAVPDLIAVVREQHEIVHIPERISSRSGFVIKPAKGSGGKGIIVITKVDNGRYFKPSGHEISLSELNRHVSNILSGLFSLGGKPDVAIIEGLIEFDPVFEGYSHEGVPDIRLIVFKGFPVMGMLRLSTAASDGKANLHQGAVGVGVDIATGKGLHAVQFDRQIEFHPDTGKKLTDIIVPHWESLLHTASSAYEMCEMGYLGTDMVLDQSKGPLLLELNARPGLAIQIANGKGILPRLKHVEAMSSHSMTVAERVAYVKTHFTG
ncbi:alpha-L-glutamate ligase-like protein [Shewanella baltica]|uniref:alpha-L-glutamate ligase-like protein n=1 Tax=Shewanella baltica TaxID=62322 RepID=UPI00217E8DD9|nr:alpha-L-glutamate ligase-like protein [Shewanella baltica]MCS6126051.1 alpha-L-glutamate ligase-like protein [Shewanella baltica]MCS6138587.1 alpha-L-glutamate ligase-like protein [Shewanella baltica]MCS6144455.1 alpha-L-glutamate ligase-like protein [Shewanella baltica]MCS6168983.1 alpha-L-glutamate ligase-like protein [Shewanella baltica]MCS6186043.1 alpha-L-glutamate ligase-like protein [Shewanella baltica]